MKFMTNTVLVFLKNLKPSVVVFFQNIVFYQLKKTKQENLHVITVIVLCYAI